MMTVSFWHYNYLLIHLRLWLILYQEALPLVLERELWSLIVFGVVLEYSTAERYSASESYESELCPRAVST